MRISLPCCRLATVNETAGARASFLTLHTGPRLHLKSKSVSSIKSFGLRPQRRHLLTLPDLSNLSPFAPKPDGNGGANFETYNEKVTLPFSKPLLFDIVSNVDNYQHFVPYCTQSKVNKSSEKQINNDTREFLADLAIGFGQFHESYTSKVTIVDGKSVTATAIPTPLFEKLETVWSFTAHSEDLTQVDFTIHYAFTNPFYAAFAKGAIEKMTSRMIDAFKGRAKEQQQNREQKT